MFIKDPTRDPYSCVRFRDVPASDRLKEQEIKIFEYFA
jgi:hypothetical protein